MRKNDGNRTRQSLLQGLTVRTGMTDCPLGSFKVIVKACSGRGDCASVCLVNVFEVNEVGECEVKNSELCFGCTACLAQCSEQHVVIMPNPESEYLTIEELLR
jgi:NAD-dependent dihydropyrimidine dehydrogenase PreA subunit